MMSGIAEPGGPLHSTFALGQQESWSFHTNPMLGNLEFTSSEHWAPFSFT